MFEQTIQDLLTRVRRVEKKADKLEKLPKGGPRVVVTTAASAFANAAAVDAAFLAAVGVDAREADALVVHRTGDDYLVVLIRDGAGDWAGVEVAGAAVSYL